ncbi:MAG: Fe-S cluster assembly protein SufB [Candidatus Jacksonbacteria bacterium RIFOXYC2_FULL_44_29]|nr:MAG: Fe-S cluster assembly protein SufB [Candidatus Jacksonbacteria bacterium RIFOXYB2_FULL_44_15]OGY76341.1 MAG: Fe-S cluster assembly protein SufB [Candidatus Jacksonbacteria bacterium RIFOXYA2_FULL_43_12]OGY77978.1 MAG: Fe-S cluster assembly protein SufB [Candidatus Jacksonbacteria bacterium RIFOXYC2_FULL_44_29]OGY81552.1 MAG: Fe-S cluster assembly protein SufB [Candidatus Jacksonbacteria bacterium RIFOXYD2_FULL_43_21]HBH45982.1 Fe-S cluster assembly protein SufB [Candidatus Jacksonbacter
MLKSKITTTKYRWGFHDPEQPFLKAPKGLSAKVIKLISTAKQEPKWMLEQRLKSLALYDLLPLPRFGPDLSKLNFDEIFYFIKPTAMVKHTWREVPASIKKTFEKLGLPQAERKFLAGVGGQYDSENVYHKLRERLERQGVIFSDVETALKTHPKLVKKYFGSVVAADDNKFAALNAAAWSGGSFIYVPPGVKVIESLQTYFRINAKSLGQFERTLIIADEGSQVHYIEGCSAPVYSSSSLHAAVVEVIALPGAKIRYTTIQNWSKNVYNLVTKRAVAEAGAEIDWVDFNLGSQATMKYPTVILKGPGAKTNILSVAFAGRAQYQDTGSKAIHLAPGTTSHIVSKSISQGGGRASFRGTVKVARGAKGARSKVECRALMLDAKSRSDTYPALETEEDDVILEHEASVSKISEEQLFYLRSRGLSEAEASLLIVNGFIEPLVKELPLEYAVEMNRLIGLEIEGM